MSKVIPAVGDALSNEHYIPAASVVMVHGATGTAYQKHFSDGLFHAIGKKMLNQGEMVALKATVVYIPPLSEDDQKEVIASAIVVQLDNLFEYGVGDFVEHFQLDSLRKLNQTLSMAQTLLRDA